MTFDGGIEDPGTNEPTLYFKKYQRTNLEDARRLYVSIVEEFVRKMNHHSYSEKKITFYDVNINLSFFNKSSKFFTDHSPAAVIRKGDMVVFLYDAGDSVEVLHEETYEEALRIVNDEKKGMAPT